MTNEEYSRISNGIHLHYEKEVERAKNEYHERLEKLLRDRDVQIIDLSNTKRFYEKVNEQMKAKLKQDNETAGE